MDFSDAKNAIHSFFVIMWRKNVFNAQNKNYDQVLKTLFLLNVWGLVGIPGIEPGSLSALVFELLDDIHL